MAVWDADPSFCSTISSPGATVRSVNEKSSATIVPDSPVPPVSPPVEP